MDLKTATNFELNKRLSELMGYVVWNLTLPSGKIITVMRKTYESDVCKIPLKDYCNSWADMGPVIEELDISLIRDVQSDNSWMAVPSICFKFGGFDSMFDIHHHDTNPLRAAVIVAIQVLGQRADETL